MRDSDFAIFWAAYKMGGFADLIMPDLEPLTFKQAMTELLGAAGFDWIVEADKPIALFLGNTVAAGRGVEVQVDWMPWATPRNKLEGTAVFIREVSKYLKVFIYAAAEHERFFFRLTRYRMLRNGCKILNYFAGGEHATMFYSPGPKT